VAKTGTTYLQRVLYQNRALLREHGFLYPAETRAAHFLASLDLRETTFKGHSYADAPGAWDRLSTAVNVHRGAALVSHETLARCSDEQVHRAVRSFDGAEVRVIVTARDLARQLPAVWQERIKNRNDEPYERFLRDVLAPPLGQGRRPAFWFPQWLPGVVQRWSSAVGPDRVTVVTVPPSGADRHELWRRFATAVELPAAPYDLEVESANTSLGVVEAELLRRLNPELKELDWPRYEAAVKRRFAELTLTRVGTSPRIVVPAEHQQRMLESSAAMIDALRAQGVQVVGDLEELRPRLDPDAHSPEVSDADLLELASRLLVDQLTSPPFEQRPASTTARAWRRLALGKRVRRLMRRAPGG
jgi:hypothetical protein